MEDAVRNLAWDGFGKNMEVDYDMVQIMIW